MTKRAKADNQLLYEWAILQILSLKKWEVLEKKFIAWETAEYEAEYEVQKEQAKAKHADNPKKCSKALNAIENSKKEYLSALKRRFEDYTRINKRLVSEFRKADNNPILELAGDHLNKFIKENFEVYEDD